jgi:protein-histidine pros-kinase
MKLLAKFNLLLLLVFGAGGLVISQVIHSFLLDNANREVLRQAELMTASATSVREYTATDIAPLLEHTEEHKKRFLPETVPFFAAMSTFDRLRQQYPDYSYREATLNPTNPEHRATDWEADVIGFLRDHPDRKRVTGERQTAMGPSMYLATPTVVARPRFRFAPPWRA